MKYAATDHRPRTLTEPDDLVDLDTIDRPDPLPAAPKSARATLGARLSGRPFPLDPRVNEIGPSLAAWIVMVVIAWTGFGAVDLSGMPAEGLERLATGAALFGVTLGGALFAAGEVAGRRDAYFRTHQFLLIAMALALLDWLPRIHAFVLIGPVLVGFGAATAIGVVLRCAFPARPRITGTISPE